MIRPPPRSTLFPSTALFQSPRHLDRPPRQVAGASRVQHGGGREPPAPVPQHPDPEPAGVLGLQVVDPVRSEEHTPELQSRQYLVCRPLLEKILNSPSLGSLP